MDLFIFIVPLAALAAGYHYMVKHLFAFFAQAQERIKQPGFEQFDTGETFDAHYKKLVEHLLIGTSLSIYAGHLFVWLCLVFYSWLSYIPAEVLLVIILFTAFHACAQFAKATSAARRWIELEARGMQWVVTNSGARYRLLWFFSDTKLIYDLASRNTRLEDEWKGRQRRQKRLTNSSWSVGIMLATWAVAYLVIERGPGLTFLLWTIYLLGIIPTGLMLATAVLDDKVFRSNAQFVTGANVFDDPPPPKKGIAAVEKQKVYGSEGFAEVGQTVAALGPPPTSLGGFADAQDAQSALRPGLALEALRPEKAPRVPDRTWEN